MKKRRHIIAIVGESGSGKTLASQLLVGPGCKTIISYTTRPMREGEVNGVDHWFVNEDRMPSKEEMCAYTLYGGYHYWTEWEQFHEWKSSATDYYFAYVIDEKGITYLYSQQQSHDFDIILVKINRPNRDDIEENRKIRDQARRLDVINFDYIINNDGTLEEFKHKINLLYQRIKKDGSTKK